MRKRVGVLLVTMVVLGFLFGLGCPRTDTDTPVEPDQPEVGPQFTLEVVIPQTGNMAFLGVPIRNALEMAERDRADGQQAIQMIMVDSQGDPSVAVSAHNQKKVTENLNGVFSFLSGPTQALKPLAASDDLLFIAATVNPAVCEGSKYLLRPYYSFGAEGRAMLEFLDDESPQTAGIIYSTDPATAFEVEEIVMPGLESMGVDVVERSYKVGERDFRNHVVAIRDATPDVVLTYGFGSDLPFLVETVREHGLFESATVVGPIGVADAIPSKGTEPFAGMYYFGPSFLFEEYAEQNAEYAKFKNDYIEKYGADAFNESSVYAYDTYNLLTHAVTATDSVEAQVLMDHVISKGFEGLAGKYAFEENGNTNPPVGLGHVSSDGTNVTRIEVFK